VTSLILMMISMITPRRLWWERRRGGRM